MRNQNPKVPTINATGYQAIEGKTQGQLIEEETAGTNETSTEESFWLGLAQSAYDESTTFLQSGLFDRWQRSYSLANSKHPTGSKYYTNAYRHRSKMFRGKTAASIRKNEAAAAVALFSTRDAVNVEADNKNDKIQVEAAEVVNMLVNSHFDNGPEWFLTCIGAYNEAQTVGVIASKQYWDYKAVDGEVWIDKPKIELIPVENIRLHPSCDWIDPINSSPYVILPKAMYIGDIRERMDSGDWISRTDGELQAAFTDQDFSVVRQARTGENQEDSKDHVSFENDFSIVWVHENFIRTGGEEVVFYTAGTGLLLSYPETLEEAYPHCKRGKRPLAFGRASIEPHKIYTTSLPERVEGAQIASNEIANQRKDNVELAMNKRKLALRNSDTDYASLMNNVPGSVTLTNNLESVREEAVTDVTGSSVNEQHLLNADFDEQAGSFSNSSISTNRAMNDTIGGMRMLEGNSNVITEYQLRIFVETWVEEVARQTSDMVKFYEDDESIARITGREVTHDMLQDTVVKARVSAGFGATDPSQKIQKLMMGLQTFAQIKPGAMDRLDGAEVSKEIFGALGFNDGKRFFPEEEDVDPKIAELTQMVQQLQQALEQKKVEKQEEYKGKMAIEQLKQQGSLKEAQIKATSSNQELILTIQNDRQLRLTEMALNRKTTVEDVMAKAGLANSDQQIKMLAEITKRMGIKQKDKELEFKRTTGRDGI